ncbi:MAG: PilZ domain-containing protein [Desulfobulbaceae bacterium]|nr:PilZ domain-containing protein [Desulfobulbaceae bacterium]
MESKADTFDGAERRRNRRFRVQDDALVFLGKDTGTILDISKGGLSVHFAAFEQKKTVPSHLDIFFAHSRFYLPNLPIVLVGEVQTLTNSIFSSLRVKRLSMKFGPLSSEQQIRLDDFILHHTVAES